MELKKVTLFEELSQYVVEPWLFLEKSEKETLERPCNPKDDPRVREQEDVDRVE